MGVELRVVTKGVSVKCPQCAKSFNFTSYWHVIVVCPYCKAELECKVKDDSAEPNS